MEWLSPALHLSLTYHACSTAPHPSTHRSVWSLARASGTTNLPTPASWVDRGRCLDIFGAYAQYCLRRDIDSVAVRGEPTAGARRKGPHTAGKSLIYGGLHPSPFAFAYVCVLAEAPVEVLCCAVRADQQSSFLVLSTYSQRMFDVTT